jgi:hypothetical protein
MCILGVFDTQEEAAVAYDNAYLARNLDQSITTEHINFTSTGELTDNAKLMSKFFDIEYKLTEEKLKLLNYANVSKDEGKRYVNYTTDDARELHSCDSYDSDTSVSKSSDSGGFHSTSSSSSDDEESEEEVGDNFSDDSEKVTKPVGMALRSALSDKTKLVDTAGPVSRLLRAVNQSNFGPLRSEWTSYMTDMFAETMVNVHTETKHKRVDQIDLASSAILRTWDSVAAASRGTNIPVYAIQMVLKGKTDNGGGFKWRFATGVPIPLRLADQAVVNSMKIFDQI